MVRRDLGNLPIVEDVVQRRKSCKAGIRGSMIYIPAITMVGMAIP